MTKNGCLKCDGNKLAKKEKERKLQQIKKDKFTNN
jgi:hypothetical protein